MGILSPLVTLLRGTGINNGGGGASAGNDNAEYDNAGPEGGGLVSMINEEED
jgi:hypothetical protein